MAACHIYKTINVYYFDLAISLLGIYHVYLAHVCKDISTKIFSAALFMIAKTGNYLNVFYLLMLNLYHGILYNH